MSSVLVTGASGFIGRSVVGALGADGHDVVRIARRRVEGRSIVLDLRNPINGLPATDWVIHLAGAYAGASQSRLERDDEAMARNVLTWGAEAGVRNWLFASAAEVYGACEGPVTEAAPTRPCIPYGTIKLRIEELFRDAARRGHARRMAILRIGEVYGPAGNLVAELGRRFQRGFCPWFGSGNVPVSFIHVSDVAAVCARVVAAAPAGLSVWNAADDEPATWRSFLDELARLLGARRAVGLPRPLPRLYAAGSTARDRLRRRTPLVTQSVVTLLTTPKAMSNRKLREELGLRLEYPDFRQGLAASLA